MMRSSSLVRLHALLARSTNDRMAAANGGCTTLCSASCNAFSTALMVLLLRSIALAVSGHVASAKGVVVAGAG